MSTTFSTINSNEQRRWAAYVPKGSLGANGTIPPGTNIHCVELEGWGRLDNGSIIGYVMTPNSSLLKPVDQGGLFEDMEFASYLTNQQYRVIKDAHNKNMSVGLPTVFSNYATK